jgi:hypothetical protein
VHLCASLCISHSFFALFRPFSGTSTVVSFTITLVENVRCVILPTGATTPTSSEINAGTGNSGSTPVSASSATMANAGSTTTISMSSLVQAVDYGKVYRGGCGTLTQVYCTQCTSVLHTVYYTVQYTQCTHLPFPLLFLLFSFPLFQICTVPRPPARWELEWIFTAVVSPFNPHNSPWGQEPVLSSL